MDGSRKKVSKGDDLLAPLVGEAEAGGGLPDSWTVGRLVLVVFWFVQNFPR